MAWQICKDVSASSSGRIAACPASAAGLYLLLGSASIDLLAQSGESLAGRIAFLELAPLTLDASDADKVAC